MTTSGIRNSQDLLHTEELLEHAEWLRRLARALVHNPDDASDLVQDTMAAALAKPPTRSGPLRPWLAIWLA